MKQSTSTGGSVLAFSVRRCAVLRFLCLFCFISFEDYPTENRLSVFCFLAVRFEVLKQRFCLEIHKVLTAGPLSGGAKAVRALGESGVVSLGCVVALSHIARQVVTAPCQIVHARFTLNA